MAIKIFKTKSQKYCDACGHLVPAGEGNTYRGEDGWVVFHCDISLCDSLQAADRAADLAAKARQAIQDGKG